MPGVNLIDPKIAQTADTSLKAQKTGTHGSGDSSTELSFSEKLERLSTQTGSGQRPSDAVAERLPVAETVDSQSSTNAANSSRTQHASSATIIDTSINIGLKLPSDLDDTQIALVHSQHRKLALDSQPDTNRWRMQTNNFQVQISRNADRTPRCYLQYTIKDIKLAAKDEAVSQSLNTMSGIVSRTKNTPRIPARMRRRVVYCLTRRLKELHPGLLVASDFKTTLITPTPIEASILNCELPIRYYDEDEVCARSSPPIYLVTVGEPKTIEISRVEQYLRTRATGIFLTDSNARSATNEVEHALNIIFSHTANLRTVRHPTYEPDLAFNGEKKYYNVPKTWDWVTQKPFVGHNVNALTNGYVWDQHGGLIALPGFFRSARGLFQPQNPILLNINTTTGAFYLGARDKRITLQKLIDDYYESTWPKPSWAQIERFIKGLRVITTYLRRSPISASKAESDRRERVFTVSGFPYTDKEGRKQYWDKENMCPRPDTVTFSGEGNRMITVETYFKNKHEVVLTPLQNSDAFVVRIGKDNFQPATELEVLAGQSFKGKIEPITYGCRPPHKNWRFITGAGRGIFNLPQLYSESFGISLAQQPLDVSYTYLDRPGIQYGRPANPIKLPSWKLERNQFAIPAQTGRWSMVQLHRGRRPIRMDEAQHMYHGLHSALSNCGLGNLIFDRADFVEDAHHVEVPNEHAVATRLGEWIKAHQRLNILVILLSDKSWYGAVKRWGDLHAGIATICVKEKGKGRWAAWPTEASVLQNLSLKFNPKASAHSANHILGSKSPLLTDRTMLVGMDVVSSLFNTSCEIY